MEADIMADAKKKKDIKNEILRLVDRIQALQVHYEDYSTEADQHLTAACDELYAAGDKL
jgi:hypothetical protein